MAAQRGKRRPPVRGRVLSATFLSTCEVGQILRRFAAVRPLGAVDRAGLNGADPRALVDGSHPHDNQDVCLEIEPGKEGCEGERRMDDVADAVHPDEILWPVDHDGALSEAARAARVEEDLCLLQLLHLGWGQTVHVEHEVVEPVVELPNCPHSAEDAARWRGSSRGNARTAARTCTVLKQPRNTLIT